MPTDTQQIIEAAEKLGQMLADHPAVAKYKDAQRSVASDPDASRLLQTFEQQLDILGRQEASGAGVTAQQRQQLEALQAQIISHIRIKALNIAQVDFIDLLRRVSQTIHRPLGDASPIGAIAQGEQGGGQPPFLTH